MKTRAVFLSVRPPLVFFRVSGKKVGEKQGDGTPGGPKEQLQSPAF